VIGNSGGTTTAGGLDAGVLDGSGGAQDASFDTMTTGGNAATGGTNGTGGMGGMSDFNPCPTSGDCTILPLGDSITDGYSTQPGGYRIELFKKAHSAGKHITFVGSQTNGPTTVDSVPFPRSHEGHSGWTIDQIAGLVPNPALKTIPNIVLLMAGTNDALWKGDTMPTAPKRLDALLDKLFTQSPGALIVLAQLTPLGGGQASKNAAVQTYNEALAPIVKERAAQGKHILLVDMHTGFPASELADGIHPNASGYARRAIFPSQ
jgi:lysophospholipase L1-like esterase